MLIAVATVTVLYVALNAVFLYTTPIAKLAGQLDVGLVAGKQIFGDAGGRIVGALICIGLVSAVSAMMWIGPRVTMAMGEDLPLLSVFARKTRERRAGCRHPVAGSSWQRPCFGRRRFEILVKFVQFSLTFCSFLAVLGVIVLRCTRPELPRPYRVWAYPLPPLLFLAMSLFMMIYLLREQPREALIGVAIMLTGLLIYFVSRTRRPIPEGEDQLNRDGPVGPMTMKHRPAISGALALAMLMLAAAPRVAGRRVPRGPTTRLGSWRDAAVARLLARGLDARAQLAAARAGLRPGLGGARGSASSPRSAPGRPPTSPRRNRSPTTCSAAPTSSTSMRSCRTDRPTC